MGERRGSCPTYKGAVVKSGTCPGTESATIPEIPCQHVFNNPDNTLKYYLNDILPTAHNIYWYHPAQETAAHPTSPNAGGLTGTRILNLRNTTTCPPTNIQNPSIFLYSIHVPLYISVMHSFP